MLDTTKAHITYHITHHITLYTILAALVLHYSGWDCTGGGGLVDSFSETVTLIDYGNAVIHTLCRTSRYSKRTLPRPW